MNKIIERMQFDQLWEEYKANKEDWMSYLKTNKNHWYKRHYTDSNIITSIMSEVAKWELVKNNDGKIDGMATLSSNLDQNNPFDRGLHVYLNTNARNHYNNKASDNELLNALVPIIPCAFKLYRDIPYEMWDRSTIGSVVSKNLAEAMLFNHNFTKDELLEIREEYIRDKDPARWYPFRDLFIGGSDKIKNRLLTSILLQIWIAHPTRRSKYMVLDTINWDNQPEPLINDEVFIKEEKPKKEKSKTSSVFDPWDV